LIALHKLVLKTSNRKADEHMVSASVNQNINEFGANEHMVSVL
jgi:hypothetical protein